MCCRAKHPLLYRVGVDERLLRELAVLLGSRHIAQHAVGVKRPAVVRADHAVMPVHLGHPAHVERRAAVRADVYGQQARVTLG